MEVWIREVAICRPSPDPHPPAALSSLSASIMAADGPSVLMTSIKGFKRFVLSRDDHNTLSEK